MEADRALQATDGASVGQERARDFLTGARQEVEDILEKAALLEARDAAILRQYLDKGTTFRDISRLTGLGQKTVARRIRRLILRLRTWRCIRLADGGLDAEEMALARSYVIKGLSIGRVAAEHGTSWYAAAKALRKVEAVTGCRFVSASGRARKGETNELLCKR